MRLEEPRDLDLDLGDIAILYDQAKKDPMHRRHVPDYIARYCRISPTDANKLIRQARKAGLIGSDRG